MRISEAPHRSRILRAIPNQNTPANAPFLTEAVASSDEIEAICRLERAKWDSLATRAPRADILVRQLDDLRKSVEKLPAEVRRLDAWDRIHRLIRTGAVAGVLGFGALAVAEVPQVLEGFRDLDPETVFENGMQMAGWGSGAALSMGAGFYNERKSGGTRQNLAAAQHELVAKNRLTQMYLRCIPGLSEALHGYGNTDEHAELLQDVGLRTVKRFRIPERRFRNGTFDEEVNEVTVQAFGVLVALEDARLTKKKDFVQSGVFAYQCLRVRALAGLVGSLETNPMRGPVPVAPPTPEIGAEAATLASA